ncbi:MAG: hypothetical protein BWY76_03281 [bacterium ADurb.Bin429]|nr:MAG: hypothetical protein BWY76_03281 [bacterium ADurb.Bin429]
MRGQVDGLAVIAVNVAVISADQQRGVVIQLLDNLVAQSSYQHLHFALIPLRVGAAGVGNRVERTPVEKVKLRQRGGKLSQRGCQQVAKGDIRVWTHSSVNEAG